jgi:hypothetical protein
MDGRIMMEGMAGIGLVLFLVAYLLLGCAVFIKYLFFDKTRQKDTSQGGGASD